MIGVSRYFSPRIVWLLIGLAVGSATLPAQSIVDQLAREICTCLEAGPLIYPRVQVSRCVDSVLDAHPRRIRNELQLSVGNADHRRRLEDLLVDPLTSDCTVIRDLPESPPAAAPRYSDLQLLQAPPRGGRKQPAADSGTQVVREGARKSTVVARLVQITANEWIVRTPEGQNLQLLVSASEPVPPRPAYDSVFRFEYQLDWHATPERVVRRLTGVKSLK